MGTTSVDVGVPIYVDLDGTLVRTDLLVESTLAMIRDNPISLLHLPFWLLRGRAYLKEQIAKRARLRFDLMPYNKELIVHLSAEKEKGRMLVLATASDQGIAHGINRHLGLFDRVMGSDGARNLKGKHKLESILQTQQGRPFDYVGDSSADIPIFEAARIVTLVDPPTHIARQMQRARKEHKVIRHPRGGAMAMLKGMRMYQWLKNVLIFVPLFTSHNWFDQVKVTHSLLGFLCFGLCASSIYLINDMFDLEADREHPTKRTRPFASGDLAIGSGVLLSLVLLSAGLGIAAWIDIGFLLSMCVYIVATSLYTLQLKQIVLVDAIVLAFLYTIRVVSGAVVIHVDVSFWLLAFSMFLFLSLSLVKRCSELVALKGLQKAGASGRDYQVGDLPLLQVMGLASGYLAVLVVALYINDPGMGSMYARQEMLWLLCPLLLYWVSRMWIKTGRGEMHFDPIVYAIRDRTSLLAVGAMIVVVMLAI